MDSNYIATFPYLKSSKSLSTITSAWGLKSSVILELNETKNTQEAEKIIHWVLFWLNRASGNEEKILQKILSSLQNSLFKQYNKYVYAHLQYLQMERKKYASHRLLNIRSNFLSHGHSNANVWSLTVGWRFLRWIHRTYTWAQQFWQNSTKPSNENSGISTSHIVMLCIS